MAISRPDDGSSAPVEWVGESSNEMALLAKEGGTEMEKWWSTMLSFTRLTWVKIDGKDILARYLDESHLCTDKNDLIYFSPIARCWVSASNQKRFETAEIDIAFSILKKRHQLDDEIKREKGKYGSQTEGFTDVIINSNRFGVIFVDDTHLLGRYGELIYYSSIAKRWVYTGEPTLPLPEHELNAVVQRLKITVT